MDNILYTQQVEEQLKQFKIENEALNQQLIDLKTDKKVKDKLLRTKTQENITLKREIEQLKKQLLLLSTQNNNDNTNNKSKPHQKFRKRKKNAVTENNIKNNNLRINLIREEQKEKKIFEGYMLKKGKFSTEFQNRYFILYANNILSYYQNIGDESAHSSMGEINLYTIINIKQQLQANENIFSLITPKRTFTLKCHTTNEYDRWIQIIKLRVSPKIICKGWLHKKGEKNKSWKLRYCILCELIEIDKLYYEIRYYEDEQCKKYKGNVICDYINEIKMLPNTSVHKYGKDKIIELITKKRIYVLSANDTKSRNIWYKSLKKVLFDYDIPFLNPQMQRPHITTSKSIQSISLPSFPSNEESNEDLSIYVLEPISEKHSQQFNANATTSTSPMLMISDNNNKIDANEWNECFAAISTSPPINKLQIVLFSDEEPSLSRISTIDTEKLMANNMCQLSSMHRTFSNLSDEFYESVVNNNNNNTSNNNRDRGISYMSDNSLMLMDMNDEINELGHIIDDKLDVMDMELSVKSGHDYNEVSFDASATNGCDDIIQSPINLYQTN